MASWTKSSRVLGSGAFSIVFLGVPVDPHLLNKVVAIKSSRPFMWGSLLREERILQSLIGCPGVLQYYGSRVTEEDGFLIYNLFLDFAPYGSLANLIRKTPLLESQVRVYTRMLLKGLSSIHRRGIVHCDLKPANILLFPSSSQDDGASYELKIADFGLAKIDKEIINAESWKFKFRGTPYYMSPESVAFGKIEAALDIWSLGCTVIEMIIGVPAWWNLTTVKALRIKLGIERGAPQLPYGLSKDCRDFLSKCFMKDPSSRWTADMLLSHPFVLSSNIESPEYSLF